MAPTPQPEQPRLRRRQRLVETAINSQLIAKLANLPLISWGIRTITHRVVSRRLGTSVAQPDTFTRISHADLNSTLKSIVTDVVETFGYVGAMVATYEADGALPIRAWHIDPLVVSLEQIMHWEAHIAHFTPEHPVSLSNPDIARVYVGQQAYRENLSIKAFAKQGPVLSDDLFDLFQPVAPESARQVVGGIQEAVGIQQVVAVPFFLETLTDEAGSPEFVGNLFALKRDLITAADQRVLAAFGRQAAAAILSERRRLQLEATLALIFDIQSHLQDEDAILARIVQGVVTHLGYVGAMVATTEHNDTLPLRAWYIDPTIASVAQIQAWEAQVARLSPEHPVSLSNPDVSRVYVHDPAYQQNLGVKAFQKRGPVASEQLYDLFQPIVPESARAMIEGIQTALGVQQVIAVPFFLATPDQDERRLVGNLFALTRTRRFSSSDIEVLQAFGQQAAAGLNNARIYRQSEVRRGAAEMFGKMAFSASTSVHDLRNKLGVVRGNLQVLNMLDQFPESERATLIAQLSEPIFRNLDQMADTLETLHEPWQHILDTLVDVNVCVQRALTKVAVSHDAVSLDLQPGLPEIYTSQDMLVEVFKVLIKNAAEAVGAQEAAVHITLRSCRATDGTIQISISDNGIGIKPEHLSRVFEMRWTTKQHGLGFGLFWTKDYIEGLGGTIEVRSTYAVGTTFEVFIPVNARPTSEEQRLPLS